MVVISDDKSEGGDPGTKSDSSGNYYGGKYSDEDEGSTPMSRSKVQFGPFQPLDGGQLACLMKPPIPIDCLNCCWFVLCVFLVVKNVGLFLVFDICIATNCCI